VLVAHWTIVVGLSARVILRRPPVGVAMAWLVVIFGLPFVGAAVYLLFGEKRLGAARAARTHALLAELAAWQSRLARSAGGSPAAHAAEGEPLARLAAGALGFPVQAGNAIELLSDFATTMDRLVADIDAARSSCHAGFYIWHEAGRTLDVAEALMRAAGRGVQVRALADALGSKAFLAGGLVRRLRAAGVVVQAALPTGPLRTLVVRADLRNHRKLVIIDGRVAYTGSQNLADPHCFKQDAGVGEWVDAMVRLTGPVATALEGVFGLDWSVESGAPFTPPEPADEAAAAAPGAGPGGAPGAAPGTAAGPAPGVAIQVAPSGPDQRPEAIHQLLLTAIFSARRELVMTSPYFVPDEAILTALLSAAQRGVAVTLIVPARNDSLLVRHASAACFDDLLSAGATIALFEGGLLHTKSLTLDDATSVFGSVNLDMRSLWLNFEISLLVFDQGFTRRLRALQESYLAGSRRLDLATWRRRPAWRRLAEDACRLVGPLL